MKPKTALAAIALLAVGITSAHAQVPGPGPATGRLLVATSDVTDPNFSESVLLILVYQDGGAAAVFLNRPTWVDPAEAFPEISALKSYDGALYLGGPVGATELLTLSELASQPPDQAVPIGGGVFFSPSPGILSRIDFTAAQHPRVRVYAGHAEWGPGQLDAEIAAGRWRLLDASPDQIFATDPVRLWQRLTLTSGGVSASLN